MSMTKRNVLFILGLVIAIGGVAIASGAFSQVEADRNVSINVTGDGQAFVSMSANDSAFVTKNNNQIEINTSGLNNRGVHQNATIKTKDAITFTNNGDTAYNVTFKTQGIDNGDLKMYKSSNDVLGSEITSSKGFELTNNGDSQTVAFKIDTPNKNADLDGTFTIHIEEAST